MDSLDGRELEVVEARRKGGVSRRGSAGLLASYWELVEDFSKVHFEDV